MASDLDDYPGSVRSVDEYEDRAARPGAERPGRGVARAVSHAPMGAPGETLAETLARVAEGLDDEDDRAALVFAGELLIRFFHPAG